MKHLIKHLEGGLQKRNIYEDCRGQTVAIDKDYTMRYPWVSPARSCYPFWGSRGARGRRGLAPFFLMRCSDLRRFWRAGRVFWRLALGSFKKPDFGLS